MKYFNDSNNCPTCDIVIHPSYPLGKIIPDRLLEDIIDKILPNLYYSIHYFSIRFIFKESNFISKKKQANWNVNESFGVKTAKKYQKSVRVSLKLIKWKFISNFLVAAKLRNMRPKRRLNKSFEDDARIKTEATYLFIELKLLRWFIILSIR